VSTRDLRRKYDEEFKRNARGLPHAVKPDFPLDTLISAKGYIKAQQSAQVVHQIL